MELLAALIAVIGVWWLTWILRLVWAALFAVFALPLWNGLLASGLPWFAAHPLSFGYAFCAAVVLNLLVSSWSQVSLTDKTK